MAARHRPLAVLAIVGALVVAAGGCEGSSGGAGDDDDDAGRGSVVAGGAGGTGSGATGGKDGSGDAAGGGASAAGGRAAAGGGGGRTSTATGGRSGASSNGGRDLPVSVAGEGGVELGTGGGVVAGSGGAKGGSGGAQPVGDGSLGSSCASEGDCASELTCLTRTSGALAGRSPAGGLCTRSCRSDAACRELAAGAYCVPFDAGGTVSFCLEGCETGPAGEPKCHRRTDVACTLIGLLPTGAECETSEDCAASELCARSVSPAVCGEIVTGCAPNCRGDFDCAPGNFCDFTTGTCSPVKPPGRAIGSSCDPNATTDPCNGFCQAKDEAGTEGVCAAFCTLAPGLYGCGWDGSGRADAACLFLSPLSAEAGIGDVGICGALCDCNADCVATNDRCVDETNGDIMSIWGRAGYCRPLEEGEAEADTFAECP